MRTETDALLSLQRHVAAAFPEFSEILTEVENEQPDRPFAVVSTDDDLTPDASTNHPIVTLPVTVYAYVQGSTRTEARKAAEDAREALWQAFAVGDRTNAERLVPLFDYTGRPAVQRVHLVARGGTWTLARDGDETDPLGARAQPRQIREAIEQTWPEYAGAVWVFGRLGGPYDVRFANGVPVDTFDLDDSGLTGPGAAGALAVLSTGSPEPWRGPRDYMRVEALTLGGLPEPSDARLRTVIASLRLTWGRLGHVRSAEMKVRTVKARPI